MNRGKETVFPYFEIEKTLKSGKRGNVHLVRYRDTKIRCIYREFAGNEEVYHKLQEIDCPHLPKIYGIQEQDGQVYVLEEYIQGDTLAFLLEGSPLTQAQTEEISMQICEALKILHGLGAVHRDVKPENIIVRGNEAVLIDFDVSRLVKPENHTDTQIMGTTGYAAPEQYGFSQTDARADIYAMGILINEMLTGQHPSKRLEAGPLRPIIERCIEVNVDKRYPTAEELRRAIGAFRKAGKKKRKLHGLGMTALLMSLLVLFGAGWLCGRSQREQVQAAAEDAHLAQTEMQMQEVEVLHQAVEISEEQWNGTKSVYTTPFRYDLDGDGEKEAYQFGIYQANIPDGYRNSLQDNSGVSKESICLRTVYPCVWRYGEEGTLEVVEEFAQLLTDARVTVWRAPGNEAPLPEAYTAESIWRGGVQVSYTWENVGTWFYEISAFLGDQELTALAQAIIFTTDA